MKTINLKGKDYAPVSARVEQFHKDHEDGSINTEHTFNEGYVIFSATVTYGSRSFNGHAFGKVGQEKAFEKIETTAVGRALAFAGYLAGGEIASYDEMAEFVEPEPQMTVAEACTKLSVCTTLDNLKTVFTSLPSDMRNDNEVVAKKDEMKSKLA